MIERLKGLDKDALCDIYFKTIDGEWDERMGDKPEWWDEYEEIVVRPAKTTLILRREKEPAVIKRRYEKREKLKEHIAALVGCKALYYRSLEWAGIAENGERHVQRMQEAREYLPKLLAVIRKRSR